MSQEYNSFIRKLAEEIGRIGATTPPKKDTYHVPDESSVGDFMRDLIRGINHVAIVGDTGQSTSRQRSSQSDLYRGARYIRERREAAKPQDDVITSAMLRDKLEQLELAQTGIQQQIQELRNAMESLELLTDTNRDSVRNTNTDMEENAIQTVHIGIIPDNVTEQAWPMLMERLLRSGVDVPTARTWMTREQYAATVAAFDAHCSALNIRPFA